MSKHNLRAVAACGKERRKGRIVALFMCSVLHLALCFVYADVMQKAQVPARRPPMIVD
jgi:hypothetical protein